MSVANSQERSKKRLLFEGDDREDAQGTGKRRKVRVLVSSSMHQKDRESSELVGNEEGGEPPPESEKHLEVRLLEATVKTEGRGWHEPRLKIKGRGKKK